MVYDISTRFDVAPIERSAELKPSLDTLKGLKQKLYDQVQLSLDFLIGLTPDIDALRKTKEKYREDPSKYVRRYVKHLGCALNDYVGRFYSLLKSAYKIGKVQLKASYATRSELEETGAPIPPELTNAIDALGANIPKAREVLSNPNYRPSIWRRFWNWFSGYSA